MIKRIRTFLTISFAGLLMLAPGLVVPAIGGVASADITTSLCSGTNVDSTAGSGDTGCGSNGANDGQSAITSIGQKVIDAFSVLVGVVSVVMIIYGGFRYITSGGDSGKVGNAKNTLIYAIIGLVIVALAQVLVHYVIQEASTKSTTINSAAS
jgi:cytochrome bd-type quinol oxidase subunit 2